MLCFLSANSAMSMCWEAQAQHIGCWPMTNRKMAQIPLLAFVLSIVVIADLLNPITDCKETYISFPSHFALFCSFILYTEINLPLSCFLYSYAKTDGEPEARLPIANKSESSLHLHPNFGS